MRAGLDIRNRELEELRSLVTEKNHSISNLQERINDILHVRNQQQPPSKDLDSLVNQLRQKLTQETKNYEVSLKAKDQEIAYLKNRAFEQPINIPFQAPSVIRGSFEDADMHGSIEPQTLTLTDGRNNRFSSIKRSPNEENLKRDLEEKNEKMNDLEAEIYQLKMDIENRDADLATLTSKIRRLEAEIFSHQASQTSAARHAAALAEKDEIIEKLEDSIRELKQKYEFGNEELERKCAKQERLIEKLEEEKRSVHVRPQVQVAPHVERIERGVVEVRYEQDPYILEQNKKLSNELKESLENERKSKFLIESKVGEISNLHVDSSNIRE